MENEKVPGGKISALIGVSMIGSSVVLGGSSDTKEDTWIAMLAAMAAALLLAWLYSSILRLHPGKNMFFIFSEVFGNIGGKIISGLYVVYAIFLGARIFAVFDDFIHIVNLEITPIAAILIISVPLIAGLVKCGLKNMASCAKFLYLVIVLIVSSTLVLGFRFMNLDNIRPILAAKPGTMIQTIWVYLTLPMGEIVLYMAFFGEVDKKESPFPIFAKGILLGGTVLLVAILRNLLLLGAPTCRLLLFASYSATGIISAGDFITRISVVIGVNLTLAGVIKISSFAYPACLGVSEIIGIKKFRKLAAPCCAFMAALSFTFYTNILTVIDFIKDFPYLSAPFQIILPVIILIVGKIKLAKKKKGAAKKAAPAPPPIETGGESD